MSASVIEQIVSSAARALVGATAAGKSVHRYRGDGFSSREMPVIVVRRGGSEHAPHDSTGRIDALVVEFAVEFMAAAAEGVETEVDALHVAAHAALLADPTLRALGKGTLNCRSTDFEIDRAEIEYSRLTAFYQINSWIPASDLAGPPL